MKTHLSLAAAFAAAACSLDAEAPADNNVAEANTATPEPTQSTVPSLAGSWTITQINGNAPGQVWPMTAQVTQDRFTLQSECRTFGWGFKQDRNIVQLTPSAGKDCGRVRSPAELIVEKPISLANIVMFSDEGRSAELSGPGGRIAMTRK